MLFETSTADSPTILFGRAETGHASEASIPLLQELLAISRLNKLHMHSSPAFGQAALAIDDGTQVYVPTDDFNGCISALQALRTSKPGIIIDGDSNVKFGKGATPATGGGLAFVNELRRQHDEIFAHAEIATLVRDTRWLPASDAPWLPPSLRAAFFDALGLWASFDGAGHRLRGREHSISFLRLTPTVPTGSPG